MSISTTPLTLEKIQTSEGVSTINESIERLSRLVPGDGETVRVYDGFADPSGSVPAGVGSLYLRKDGSTGTSVYVKESGTDATGWSAIGGSSFPTGGIIMWSGAIADIPDGWVLCDGDNDTPDLTNRFIVGADADVDGTAKSTVTGSALQTSDGEVISHTHTFDVYEGYAPGTGYIVSRSNPQTPTWNKTTDSTGGTKNVATFYALAYIMKT